MRTISCALLSLAIVSGGVLVVACSSAPAASGLASDDQTASPAGATTTHLPASTPTAASTPAPAPTTPPVVDADAGTPAVDSGTTPPAVQADCSITTTADSCYQCCDSNTAGGVTVADNAFFACICTAPGVCAQACADSVCGAGGAGAQPSHQCQSCMNSNAGSQCNQAADTACQASASCQAADTCLQANSCDNKQ